MTAEFHQVNIKNFGVRVEQLANGEQRVSCPEPLGPFAQKITDKLDEWAKRTPDTDFICQRDSAGQWQRLTYAQTLAQVKRLAGWMTTQNLSVDRPVVILSGNSIEHLLVALASMYIGIPYAPVSTAYSLVSSDYGKLKHIFKTLTPGLIFADNLGQYRTAIDSVNAENSPVVCCQTEPDQSCAYQVSLLDTLFNTPNTSAVERANRAVTGDSIAKFLFTSGSTGMPKAVINTQRMLCANQQMIRSVFAFLQDEKPIILDWLPWNHTFGGNHNVGIVLYNGGTFYIDEGKPVATLLHHTLNNLKEISPTVYFNVPKGYELLVNALKQNSESADGLFKNLRMLFFAGAGLSQHVWDELDALAIQQTGKKIPMLTGLGATETAPSATFASVEECASGVIGTPCPGVELKLVPCGNKTELRVKALTITPGYWRNDEQTEKAFDPQGYYCFGDAVKWIDANNPNRGMLFDGRISEDFKLDTGTWVSVGILRAKLIQHFAPYVSDAVICGRDRSDITAMIFPDVANVKQLVPHSETMDTKTLVSQPKVIQQFLECLRQMAETSTGSSTRINRITLLIEPASIDHHEITDKGSINQSAVMARRQTIMNSLYDEPLAAHVISL